MDTIYSYIAFDGNCREAMNFYKECFGGELSFQTVGDGPMVDRMPATMKDSIMHSELSAGKWKILASDLAAESGLVRGNALSMMLTFDNEPEIRAAFDKLAVGSKASRALEATFWGALFGSVTDKYGVQWLLDLEGYKKP